MTDMVWCAAGMDKLPSAACTLPRFRGANMAVALYQGDGAHEVRFELSRADFVIIGIHSDGVRISRDI
jgi:hypothetical protein